MEVTQAQFARMCGVKPSSISDKISKGTLILNSGKKMDTDNPVNRAYLTAKQNKLQLEAQAKSAASFGGAATGTEKGKSVGENFSVLNATATAGIEGLSEAMLHMTLLQLVTSYGGLAGVERFSKTLQTLTNTNEKEIRIKERRQELIPKDFVTSRLFGYVDQLMSKLLDWPEGAVDTIIAKVLASKQEARADLVNYMRDGLTHCICDAKQHIASELDGLRGKYDTSKTEIEELKEAVEGLKNE